MARQNGTILCVIGFNPYSYMAAQVKSIVHNVMGTKNRFTCRGKWYNDLTMIHDPTAISLELECSLEQVKQFADSIQTFVGKSGVGDDGTGKNVVDFEYTFLPAAMESNDHPFVGHCTELALVVLSAWLFQWEREGGEHVTELARARQALFALSNSTTQAERNLSQGKVMSFIATYNENAPPG